MEANWEIAGKEPEGTALRESEERYRRWFEEDLTGDCVTTPEGRILTCNPAFIRIFGFPSREEALRSNLFKLYVDPEAHARFVRLLKERRRLERHESVRRRWDGSLMDVVENAVGSFDENGDLVEITTYTFDNTERKQAERALEQARERYRLLVELIPDAVWVSDDQKIWFANPAAARLLGAASPGELVGYPLTQLFHPEHRAQVQARTKRVMAGGIQLPLERRKLVRLDGENIEVETAVGPCDFEERKAVVRVSRDITERRRQEEALVRKDEEISRHAEKVGKLNTALKVLLEHRGRENRQKEENMRATLDRLVLPYLEEFKTTRLDEAQLTLVEIIEANLRDLSSSFARELAVWHERLTPSEIRVADLVAGGKRSKEIASLLRISESAVAFHRANIRAKLGLRKGTNLVSYLQALGRK